jgi:hypothetical protein
VPRGSLINQCEGGRRDCIHGNAELCRRLAGLSVLVPCGRLQRRRGDDRNHVKAAARHLEVFGLAATTWTTAISVA